jgi:arsenate reductase
MAEGFANHYGSDVLEAFSSGLAPVNTLARETRLVMQERNIDISSHVPRPYDPFLTPGFDIIVNMAGYRLPGVPPRELMAWTVSDPYGSPVEAFRKTRDDIEQRVMRLILDLRRRARNAARSR